MTTSALVDQLEAQIMGFDELSIDDIQRRMQWVWRQMIAATRDMDAIELGLRDAHKTLDPKWDTAYETSMLSQEKRLNARFHEVFANNRCRDELQVVAGLESQLRIASRWFRALEKIHDGLRTHAANVRAATS